MLDAQTVEALIAAVRSAARAEIIPRFRALQPGQVTTKSAHDDLVTAADTGMEARLTPIFSQIMPKAAILGEEAAASNEALMDLPAEADMCVILDPVDGTWNFANGISVFGTIVAVTQNADTVFSLLYDPFMDDWIQAEPGKGAWYHRTGAQPERLSFDRLDASPDAQLGLCAPSLFPKPTRPDLARELTTFGRVHSLRCSCHEYRLLASSGADWLMAYDPKPWDHAAGSLVIREAGGVVRWHDDGSDYQANRRHGTVLAARTETDWFKLQERFENVL